jgi:hypothetical protein
MSFLQKIVEKGRTGSAWKQGVWGEGRDGDEGRNDSNNVCKYE